MDSSWLRPAAAGLEILPARAFIDPLRPVDLAIITHAHADHARPGHKQVIATAQTLAIMAAGWARILLKPRLCWIMGTA